MAKLPKLVIDILDSVPSPSGAGETEHGERREGREGGGVCLYFKPVRVLLLRESISLSIQKAALWSFGLWRMRMMVACGGKDAYRGAMPPLSVGLSLFLRTSGFCRVGIIP